MIKIILFIGIIGSLVSSCTELPSKRLEKSSNSKRQAFIEEKWGDDLGRYTLSGLPNWANFSQTGKCQRSGEIVYYDLTKLHESYGISYSDSMHFQHVFNVLLKQQKDSSGQGALSLRDEELVFSETKQRVIANNMIFKRPEFLKVNLIWIDPALSDEKLFKRLKSFLQNPNNLMAHPVLVSMCLREDELEKFNEKNGFISLHTKLLSAEFFSIYNETFMKRTYFGINFKEFFMKEQKLTLVVPDLKKVPEEFNGFLDLNSY